MHCARYLNNKEGPIHKYRNASRAERRKLDANILVRTVSSVHAEGVKFRRVKWMFCTQSDYEPLYDHRADAAGLMSGFCVLLMRRYSVSGLTC